VKLKLTNVRLSFPALFEPEQYQGDGRFNYKATFLIPADDPQKATIDQAILAVAKENWKDKAAAIIAANAGNPQRTCWLDGALRTYDGYAGNWALSTSRPQEKGRPLVIDQAKNPLTQADGKPYAGCYVNASVELWPQDNKHGKAVRCTLLGVQFVRDGDAFSAGSVASPDDFDDFDALAEGATADDLA
jgi:hypothetical protein